MNDTPSDLLPISGNALTAHPQLDTEVCRFSSLYGLDYFDNRKVGAMLAERQADIRRTSYGALVWISSLAGTVGFIWILWAGLSKPEKIAVAIGPPAALIVLAVVGFVRAYRQAKRKLRHPHLEGYRHVLAAALAHGVPVTHVPDWLIGRSGSGEGAAPLPSYRAPVGGPAHGGAHHAFAQTGAPAPLPPKPQAVAEYERIADQGGSHDEIGCLLVIGAAVGVGTGFTKDMPVAFAAGILAPIAIWFWVAGHRLGKRKRALEARAREYVQQLTAAQASGAVVPELSPQLRKLLDTP